MEFKGQKAKFELLMDEVSKTKKSNAEYRSLILETETKLAAVNTEI